MRMKPIAVFICILPKKIENSKTNSNQEGENMSIHDGHRKRLRNRFRAEGLENFTEREVLDLLLFYTRPRVDTTPLAQSLLDHFGSLSNVLEAPAEELQKVPGIGENTATFLTLMNEVGRYYQIQRSSQNVILSSTEKCGEYLVPHFLGLRNETVFLLCLDSKCKAICCKRVGEGSVNSASVSVRRIVELALGANATTVILAHNHPSGLALPSGDDVQTTFLVAKALKTVGIELADHIIVADSDFVSLAQSGLYSWDDSRIKA